MTPLEICEKYTRENLDMCCTSWRIVMGRLLERSSEMEEVYEEVCQVAGRNPAYNGRFQLVMEAIWTAPEYDKPSIAEVRASQKELASLQDNIQKRAQELGAMLERYNHLLETSDFSPEAYPSCLDVLDTAGQNNGHYQILQRELDPIRREFGGKYWPNLSEIALAIGELTGEQGKVTNEFHPEEVLNAFRQGEAKDFVLVFDKALASLPEVPTGFEFSNRAMATIFNVVLNKDPEDYITDGTVKNARNRNKKRKK